MGRVSHRLTSFWTTKYVFPFASLAQIWQCYINFLHLPIILLSHFSVFFYCLQYRIMFATFLCISNIISGILVTFQSDSITFLVLSTKLLCSMVKESFSLDGREGTRSHENGRKDTTRGRSWSTTIAFGWRWGVLSKSLLAER